MEAIRRRRVLESNCDGCREDNRLGVGGVREHDEDMLESKVGDVDISGETDGSES